MGFVPQFVDINGDGLKDMISGSFHGDPYQTEESKESGKPVLVEYPEGGWASEIYVFYQQQDGTFAPRQWLAYCHPHSVATPVDWDGDGDIDLITAYYVLGKNVPRSELINLLENTGSKTQPEFARPQPLLTGFPELQILPASAYAVDWDGDGDLDLLASAKGENGTILFFERIARQESGAIFNAPVSLISEDALEAEDSFKWRDVFSISVVDFNQDGLPDVLAGTDWYQQLTEEELLARLSEEEKTRYYEARAKVKEFESKVSEIRPAGAYQQWTKVQQDRYSEEFDRLLAEYGDYMNLLNSEFNTRIPHGYVYVFYGSRDE